MDFDEWRWLIMFVNNPSANQTGEIGVNFNLSATSFGHFNISIVISRITFGPIGVDRVFAGFQASKFALPILVSHRSLALIVLACDDKGNACDWLFVPIHFYSNRQSSPVLGSAAQKSQSILGFPQSVLSV